jgi:alcohol dehydrogenase, propanol-preferring
MMNIPRTMRAMVMEKAKTPLKEMEIQTPQPSEDQILIKVNACGVCRTDLHILDGELTQPKLPLVLGHQIAGVVAGMGKNVSRFAPGDRVGVPWVGYTDGTCRYCQAGQENLCEHAKFTGYDLDGGYAEYSVADQRYCFPLPPGYSDIDAAPLLCAGLIGYRSYRLTGENVQKIGLYGFGASAHIIIQVAVFQGKQVYAFTVPGDTEKQAFARRLGAVWAGGSDERPPEALDAAILFAPVGALVPVALRAVRPGGTVVCAGIYMSDIPSFPYSILWEERVLRSVANLTRQDGEELLQIATRANVKTQVTEFPLAQANQAIDQFRHGKIEGAAVLKI